jgi:hypothetical protein
MLGNNDDLLPEKLMSTTSLIKEMSRGNASVIKSTQCRTSINKAMLRSSCNDVYSINQEAVLADRLNLVRSQVLTAVVVKIPIFWDIKKII